MNAKSIFCAALAAIGMTTFGVTESQAQSLLNPMSWMTPPSNYRSGTCPATQNRMVPTVRPVAAAGYYGATATAGCANGQCGPNGGCSGGSCGQTGLSPYLTPTNYGSVVNRPLSTYSNTAFPHNHWQAPSYASPQSNYVLPYRAPAASGYSPFLR